MSDSKKTYAEIRLECYNGFEFNRTSVLPQSKILLTFIINILIDRKRLKINSFHSANYILDSWKKIT